MRQWYKLVICLILCLILSLSVFAAVPRTLIPGGNTIGLQLDTQGVSIVEITSEGAKKAGLAKGDVLQKINGLPVTTPGEVTAEVEKSQGAPLELTVLRNGKEKSFTLAPKKTQEGWQLGLMVREGINGIGTVTYYNKEDQSFGALGHGVNEGKALLPLRQGQVFSSRVVSVQQGKKGEPGALQGAMAGRSPIGVIWKNTSCGIFGTMDCPEKASLPVATAAQVHEGEATILSNVVGTEVREYSVKILELNPRERLNRNLLLEVTDPSLLQETGGIVQGMSGSPIIQDGKLVGAVTHVLMDDPTRGYGILMENMLDAA